MFLSLFRVNIINPPILLKPFTSFFQAGAYNNPSSPLVSRYPFRKPHSKSSFSIEKINRNLLFFQIFTTPFCSLCFLGSYSPSPLDFKVPAEALLLGMLKLVLWRPESLLALRFVVAAGLPSRRTALPWKAENSSPFFNSFAFSCS